MKPRFTDESEVLANVGIAVQNRPNPSQAQVNDIQAKFRLYPNIRDERAPLAYGRLYASEQIQISVVQ